MKIIKRCLGTNRISTVKQTPRRDGALRRLDGEANRHGKIQKYKKKIKINEMQRSMRWADNQKEKESKGRETYRLERGKRDRERMRGERKRRERQRENERKIRQNESKKKNRETYFLFWNLYVKSQQYLRPSQKMKSTSRVRISFTRSHVTIALILFRIQRFLTSP